MHRILMSPTSQLPSRLARVTSLLLRAAALRYQLVGVEGQADDGIQEIGQGRDNGGHERGSELGLMRMRRTHMALTTQTMMLNGMEQHLHRNPLRRHPLRRILSRGWTGRCAEFVFGVPAVITVRQQGAAGGSLAW